MLTSDQIFIGALIRYNKIGHPRHGLLARIVSLDSWNDGANILGVRFFSLNYINDMNFDIVFVNQFESANP